MNDRADARGAQAALTGQVALVTGGGRGIGREIVRALARAGATVIAAARTRPEVDETVALVARDGGTARATALDVTDRGAVDGVVGEVLAELGRIDVLVNNA